MKTPETFKIENVALETIVHIRRRLAEDGVTTSSPNGESPITYINAHGIIAALTYDEVAKELNVTVNHKPFYLPTKVVEHKLIDYIDELEVVAPTVQDKSTPVSDAVTEVLKPEVKSVEEPKIEVKK